jgi:diadenosine tetraphosphate (Ap4A) HIT family hydrolase
VAIPTSVDRRRVVEASSVCTACVARGRSFGLVHPGEPNHSGDCVLCREVKRGGASLHLLEPQSSPERPTNILLETDNFLLLRDVSPVVAGHCLIVSRRHLSCFAHIPARHARELRDFRDRVWGLVAQTSGAPFLFEHGAAGRSGGAGSCVDHAHLHFLPVRAPVRDWIAEFGEARLDASTSPSLREAIEPYLWYQDQEGHGYLVASVGAGLPCQFIRRRIAAFAGTTTWDWRIRPTSASL